MTIQVLAEREQKIQSDVKEIRKVFYCELCSKQYRTVMEFEGHLSSYDHNHKKRFKEMKEMHGASGRDDRKKREQQRQEREMTKMADARKQHQMQQSQQEVPENVPVSAPAKTTVAPLAVQDQRKTLKFGFSSKSGIISKSQPTSSIKKPKVAIASVFGNDSDED
ncbi:hypothetical protein AXX17_AT5G26630 [Arabidopsis thaliana]|uniref:C2H2-type domain-containing protein n=1 Tax=Arabidopsis thaliana TaxID=3702 RepID=A0A178UM02_ARATH|nr:hypothetical protein AXX17_AT5G26630 [Arabidopsis thaliana]